MTTKVLNVREHEFTGDEDKQIKGMYIYLEITKGNGEVETRRVFIGEDRLADFAYIPKAGDNVVVFASGGKVVDFLKAK